MLWDRKVAVDEEVVAIVRQQYDKARQILKDNAAKLNEIAAYLLSARPLPVRNLWRF